MMKDAEACPDRSISVRVMPILLIWLYITNITVFCYAAVLHRPMRLHMRFQRGSRHVISHISSMCSSCQYQPS